MERLSFRGSRKPFPSSPNTTKEREMRYAITEERLLELVKEGLADDVIGIRLGYSEKDVNDCRLHFGIVREGEIPIPVKRRGGHKVHRRVESRGRKERG